VQKSIGDERSAAGKLMLSIILPILFFVFSATTPMAVAADLVAGEKERNTLEPLLCVPVSRMEILAGKALAVVATGLVGSCAFMSGIAISYLLTPEAFGAKGMTLSVDTYPLIGILLCAVALVTLLGSMELCISIFSRSIKEAQILFLPLILVSMGCGYASIILDVKNIPLFYRFIPLVNVGVLIKELSVGIIHLPFIALSFFECGAVIAFVCFVSFKMFSSEKYIFRG